MEFSEHLTTDETARKKQLSVIISNKEGEEDESEYESQYGGNIEEVGVYDTYELDDGKTTLQTGKETSKKKKKKSKAKKDKQGVKKQGSAMCSNGNDKACCTIF
jgi:hypothetical protein